MRFTANVGEHGALTIPDDVMQTLALSSGACIDVDVNVAAKPKVFDDAQVDAAMKKWAGSQREEFLAEGWTSVQDYVDEMRGR